MDQAKIQVELVGGRRDGEVLTLPFEHPPADLVTAADPHDPAKGNALYQRMKQSNTVPGLWVYVYVRNDTPTRRIEKK